jgi:hypothetical protein
MLRFVEKDFLCLGYLQVAPRIQLNFFAVKTSELLLCTVATAYWDHR